MPWLSPHRRSKPARPAIRCLARLSGGGPGSPACIVLASSTEGQAASSTTSGTRSMPHRNRQVISAPMGPTVAFFGDSMTFGQGVPDADTLPQAFADATGYRWRVLNLAFPGYGPQQFLRALETDIFRDLLTEPRLFVFLTAPWHAERSSCLSRLRGGRAALCAWLTECPATRARAASIGRFGCDGCGRAPRCTACFSSRCSAERDRWTSICSSASWSAQGSLRARNTAFRP